VKKRLNFENKNKYEKSASSFLESHQRADICFEFSSEGEFQQAAPLIHDAIEKGMRIELVFFSPSVEKTILDLAKNYPEQIRYLRYPFLTMIPIVANKSFSQWVTANKLVLIRYDFFPEFLLWSLNSKHKLFLLWMTFKKERLKGISPSFWKREFLKKSSCIFYATKHDAEYGKDQGFPGEVFDFRIEQIQRRISVKDQKLQKLFPDFLLLPNILKNKSKSLIFGNVWPSDLFLIEKLPKDVFLIIVPHLLDEKILNQFRNQLTRLNRKFNEIGEVGSLDFSSDTILINKKGILCELYTFFDHAYVGGGFEVSIHSILEPLVAGSNKIACGPKHGRSTEFDMALSFNKITTVRSSDDLIKWLNKSDAEIFVKNNLFLSNDYKKMREILISC
jgi:3-deoxy-D-manno-octulosonic-acid transferase